jgi:hypothetical protein
MITLNQALLEIVARSPLLEEYMATGLLNYSAVSRYIKPEVDKRLFKDVSDTSIMMALKRLSLKLPKTLKSFDVKGNLKDLTLKSNFIELTYAYSQTLADSIHKLYLEAADNKDFYCAHTQGVSEATIIVNENYRVRTMKLFSDEKLISEIDSLSAVILKLSDDTVTTSGVYYTLLKYLAMAGINVYEMISTTHELTILFKDKDIQEAFSVLRKMGN